MPVRSKLSYLSKRKDSTTDCRDVWCRYALSCHTSPNERILQRSFWQEWNRTWSCHTSPNERILQPSNLSDAELKDWSCHTSPNERILQLYAFEQSVANANVVIPLQTKGFYNQFGILRHRPLKLSCHTSPNERILQLRLGVQGMWCNKLSYLSKRKDSTTY